jgi:cobalt-precorrin-5B (C1)-methyltransferase
VRKDAGDDPDATDGLEIVATVSWTQGPAIRFAAGQGVGTVTKPGLSIPPGEPAINPSPRRMIAAAVRQVTERPLCVEIAIPGGRKVAARTFNPRLGIEGGLSVLGTTGIVRPYCRRALHDALACALDVAAACGVTALALAPGNIGARAAGKYFFLRSEQLVEVGNAWNFVLDRLGKRFQSLLIVGHPGKLAKLAAGQWDTHSARSSPPTTMLATLHVEILGRPAAESPTVEGVFAALPLEERSALADALASRVCTAVSGRLPNTLTVAAFLVDMAGKRLGAAGNLSPWQELQAS